MHRALREVRAGLWFDWWFQELAQTAGERVQAEAARKGDAWQAPWRLLHGLAAIASPALRSAALQRPGPPPARWPLIRPPLSRIGFRAAPAAGSPARSG
ncbi:MAG TPA: hypothetical protein DHU96_18775 [Actinobacteria bacterium]|nr:hypothetical protein [Actinomycetota bacterium]